MCVHAGATGDSGDTVLWNTYSRCSIPVCYGSTGPAHTSTGENTLYEHTTVTSSYSAPGLELGRSQICVQRLCASVHAVQYSQVSAWTMQSGYC
jgi:hypothetical protein